MDLIFSNTMSESDQKTSEETTENQDLKSANKTNKELEKFLYIADF